MSCLHLRTLFLRIPSHIGEAHSCTELVTLSVFLRIPFLVRSLSHTELITLESSTLLLCLRHSTFDIFRENVFEILIAFAQLFPSQCLSLQLESSAFPSFACDSFHFKLCE